MKPCGSAGTGLPMDRYLSSSSPLELLQGLAQFFFRDVENPYLEHLVRLGVVHHVTQAAPSPFQLLEVGMVDNQIDLFGELTVQLGDDGFYALDGIVRDGGNPFEDKFSQGGHRRFDRLLGPL